MAINFPTMSSVWDTSLFHSDAHLTERQQPFCSLYFTTTRHLSFKLQTIPWVWTRRLMPDSHDGIIGQHNLRAMENSWHCDCCQGPHQPSLGLTNNHIGLIGTHKWLTEDRHKALVAHPPCIFVKTHATLLMIESIRLYIQTAVLSARFTSYARTPAKHTKPDSSHNGRTRLPSCRKCSAWKDGVSQPPTLMSKVNSACPVNHHKQHFE